MADIQGLLDKYSKIKDERFFGELFREEEYKPVLDLKDAVMIDIGALAGEFCAYAYDSARVIYAIEPLNENYQELEGNVKEFKLDRVKPYNLALSNNNGTGYLTTDSTRGGNKLAESGQEVQTRTLAQFMKDEGIDRVDVLKIDIEDGEDAVFKSSDFKDVVGKIQMIIGEHLGGFQEYFKSQGFDVITHRNNLVFKRP